MNRHCLYVVMILAGAPAMACAQGQERAILSFGYSGNGRIVADVDQDDVDPNRYSGYSLEMASVQSLRITLPSYRLYGKFTRIEGADDEGREFSNRFNSISAGITSRSDMYLSDSLRGYMMLGAGAGVGRFNFDSLPSRAMGEVGVETGFLFSQRISIGLGIEYQIFGFPGETVSFPVK